MTGHRTLRLSDSEDTENNHVVSHQNCMHRTHTHTDSPQSEMLRMGVVAFVS